MVSFINVLGGGVIGDLAGYVAASFLRGVRLIHIPTTVLSMCDSCIGGKVGIDSPLGKNLIGAIHQPYMVMINIRFLNSLDERNFKNGLVEVIKIGAIYDSELFDILEKTSL